MTSKESIEGVIAEAEQCAAEGNLPEMIKKYNRVLQLEPAELKHLYNKAVLLMQMKKYKLALDAFYEYVTSDSQDPDVWYNIGICFTALKSYEDAKEAFEYTLLLEKTADTYLQLGKTLHIMGDLPTAKESLTTALEYQNNALRQDIQFALANVLTDQQDYQGALQILHAINCEDTDPLWRDVQYNLANTYLDLQQYEMAIESYQRLIDQYNDFNSKFNLAYAYETVNPEQSITLYKQLLANAYDHYAIYYNLACVYARMQRLQKAIEYIDKMFKVVYDKKGMVQRIKADPDFQELLQNVQFCEILQSHY